MLNVPEVLVAVFAPVLIVISLGSSSSVPNAPATAVASTKPVKSSRRSAEVSTKPPSPPAEPPVTLILPANRVRSCDHSTTAPPAPSPSALIVAPAAISTVAAWRSAVSLYRRAASAPPR